jgi:hypothetical protein
VNTASGLFFINNTIAAGKFSGLVGYLSPGDIISNVSILAHSNLIGDAGTSGGLQDGVNGNIVGNNGSGTLDIHTVLDTSHLLSR